MPRGKQQTGWCSSEQHRLVIEHVQTQEQTYEATLVNLEGSGPLTRSSTPTPCRWHPKKHKIPGFFHFLLWACVYSVPNLGVLSPTPSEDLSLGLTIYFALHCFTLSTLAPSLSISTSISVKVLEFPFGSLHAQCRIPSKQGLFLSPNLVCLPQPRMRSDMLHILAFVINTGFDTWGWEIDLLSSYFSVSGKGKDYFSSLFLC